MRRRGARVCKEPGCPELRPCPIPGHERAPDNRPSAAARGYDRQWQRTRSAYLFVHETCEWPSCGAPAIEVDHKDGEGPNGPRGHDWDNLQALCKPHHSAKTARENGGFGNEPRQP